MAGAELLSAEWKYSDEEWPAALASKGLKADKPVALYGTPREVAEVAVCCASRASSSCSSCRDGKRRPGHLARWQQLVHPLWLADLQAGKPVIAAPRGVEGVRGGLGIPKAYLLSHIPGAGYIDTNRLEGEPLWNKVSDEALKALLLENGIRRLTPPSSSMAATPWRRPVRPI